MSKIIVHRSRPLGVSIERRRWEVLIHISHESGEVETFVASADSLLTQGDSIWFDTEKETRKAEAAA